MRGRIKKKYKLQNIISTNKFIKILVYCLIFLAVLVPILFLVYLKYVNTFFWWPLSSIALALNRGYLTIEFPYQPVLEALLYSISSVSGLTGLQLAIIPLGAFIVPICYFALSNNVCRDSLMAILLTANIAYDFTIYSGQYSVFVYTWTNALFLSFVLIYLLYLKSNNPKYVILLFLIFFAIYNIHPTYTFWIMLFILFFSLSIIFAKKLNFNKIHSKSSIYLSLAFLVIYFGFNEVIYKVYLRKVILIEPEIISYEFISTIGSFLGLSIQSPEQYALQSAPPNQILGYASFIRTCIILAVLLIALFIWLKQNYKNISKEFDNDIILIGALFMVGVTHLVAYALYGHMSLRFVTLIYPIVTLLVLQKIYARKAIQIAFLVILIFLGFLQTGSFIIENYHKPNDISQYVQPSSSWLLDKQLVQSKILSDFETSQLFYFYFKGENRSFVQKFYDSNSYDMLVNSTYVSTENQKLRYIADYVLINNVTIDNPASFRGWKSYETLSKYLIEINDNNNINKIYDDERIWIFKTG